MQFHFNIPSTAPVGAHLTFAKKMKDYPHDPIEDDPEFMPIIEAASQAAKLELSDHPCKGQRGFYSFFWAAKKRILKERYSIDWKTPREMDPDRLVMWD